MIKVNEHVSQSDKIVPPGIFKPKMCILTGIPGRPNETFAFFHRDMQSSISIRVRLSVEFGQTKINDINFVKSC